ncbi:uncharacterized protein MONBRDRAFT_22395 [Monosiga brevicollis MX1]|uniref:AP-5 complex subunit beta-1 n=1 Tax=Monosiga brevicollis TaxID=81824 RepID=A9UQG3_MONBE|nr:uncharacterized protein MONBRDRAFT_22395 [Monosiga brevicollis MX1]EDQ92593.1 predicted protein [Monosiga brevicollis MX1]|eukprot:XP_001742355.1 hypothetical protein [Monosiga brevicollis MX1]
MATTSEIAPSMGDPHAAIAVASMTASLVDLCYRIVTEADQGPYRLRLLLVLSLCQQAPLSVGPKTLGPPVEPSSRRYLMLLLARQGLAHAFLSKHFLTLTRWLKEDTALSLAAFPTLSNVADNIPHSIEPIHVQEAMGHVSRSFARAPPQVSENGRTVPMKDLNGDASMSPFTPLCLGKTYENEHLNSIQSFSGLRKWLKFFARPSELSHDEGQPALYLIATTRDACIEIVTRIIDQLLSTSSNDWAKLGALDAEFAFAALSEALLLLQELMRLDEEFVVDAVPTLQRVLDRARCVGRAETALGWANAELLCLRVLLSHDEKSTMIDCLSALDDIFTQKHGRHMRDPYFAGALMALVTDFIDLLSAKGIVDKYCPAIFKLLAWHPVLLLRNFQLILPMLLNDQSCLEVLHLILDLPCVTGALVMLTGTKLEALAAKSDNPHLALPLLNYILRDEGGLGGTIDRLKELHALLLPAATNARVVKTASVVHSLLDIYFEALLRDAGDQILGEVVLLMLERIVTIYQACNLSITIQGVFSRMLLELFYRHPSLLLDLREDLLEFLNNRQNMANGREEFFSHLVWIVGEYASPQLDERCDTSIFLIFHEALETFAYELNSTVKDHRSTGAQHPMQILCMLMMALAKLATRCPELRPRVALNLKKIHSTFSEGRSEDELPYIDVVHRARVLANILKQPAVAEAVLNVPPLPPHEQEDLHGRTMLDAASVIAAAECKS